MQFIPLRGVKHDIAKNGPNLRKVPKVPGRVYGIYRKMTIFRYRNVAPGPVQIGKQLL